MKGYFDVETTEPKQAAGKQLALANQHAHDVQEARAEAARLKESITQQLAQGAEPQVILLTALKAIGILTNDDAWTEATTGQLDALYKGLAQQSFIQDNAAIAQARLDALQEDYNKKLRAALTRKIAEYRRVNDALQTALNILDNTEQDFLA